MNSQTSPTPTAMPSTDCSAIRSWVSPGSAPASRSTASRRYARGLRARRSWERTPDPGDGRAVVAAITGEGRRRYEQLQADRSALLQEYLHGLDADGAARLAAALPLLEGLADHLRDHQHTGVAAR